MNAKIANLQQFQMEDHIYLSITFLRSVLTVKTVGLSHEILVPRHEIKSALVVSRTLSHYIPGDERISWKAFR